MKIKKKGNKRGMREKGLWHCAKTKDEKQVRFQFVKTTKHNTTDELQSLVIQDYLPGGELN